MADDDPVRETPTSTTKQQQELQSRPNPCFLGCKRVSRGTRQTANYIPNWITTRLVRGDARVTLRPQTEKPFHPSCREWFYRGSRKAGGELVQKLPNAYHDLPDVGQCETEEP